MTQAGIAPAMTTKSSTACGSTEESNLTISRGERVTVHAAESKLVGGKGVAP